MLCHIYDELLFGASNKDPPLLRYLLCKTCAHKACGSLIALQLGDPLILFSLYDAKPPIALRLANFVPGDCMYFFV